MTAEDEGDDEFCSVCSAALRVDRIFCVTGPSRLSTFRLCSGGCMAKKIRSEVTWLKERGSTRAEVMAFVHSRPPRFDERAVLAFDPFAGDFGDPGDVRLADKMVTRRKSGGKCSNCFGPIPVGTRCRVRKDIVDGDLCVYHWCEDCCRAMAEAELDGGEKLNQRHEDGVARLAREQAAGEGETKP